MDGREEGGDGVSMTVLWTGMAACALVCGLITGRGEAVSAAALYRGDNWAESCRMAALFCWRFLPHIRPLVYHIDS